MRSRSALIAFTLFVLLLAASSPVAADPGGPASPASPLGAGFTYQGRLQNGPTSVNGSCDMAFRLYDAVSGGAPVGAAITTPVTVTAGLFSVPLDFGSGVFTGQDRWLDIQVKCGADPGYTPLSPRQALTASPYALYALSAGIAPYGGLTGVPTPLHDLASPAACGTAQVATWNGSTWTCALVSGSPVSAGAGLVLTGTTFALDTSYTDGRYWKLTGNSGTSAPNFLGTTDNMTLTLAVNGAAGFRLVPNGTSPDVIGGSSSNSVGAGVVGATIGGGGSPIINNGNRVTANFGTVGGGNANAASGNLATIGGGRLNAASGLEATVSGGLQNNASGDEATVGGGEANSATAPGATVGGGGWDGTTLESNVATGNASIIGGGLGNVISPTAGYGTVGGGLSNTNNGLVATIGGGQQNVVSDTYATVGGGFANLAGGNAATVAGGGGNSATGTNASVGGGQADAASGGWATVGGGYYDTASGFWASVGGGLQNTADGGSAAISGGQYNNASGTIATIGGGNGNHASGAGATVGGGGFDGVVLDGNVAAGAASTIGGGLGNVISSTATYATIAGGISNTVGGQYATVAGGFNNSATATGSLAAGQNAHATETGSFVWGDGTQLINATNLNTFNVLATGGFFFYMGPSACELTDATGWACLSDRNLKEKFTPLDGRKILDALSRVPVTEWNVKGSTVKHIGPTAQDFYAAFNVGADDRHINTVDEQGVALAAIQGLYTVVQAKDGRIATLETAQAELQARVAALEGRAAPDPAQPPLGLPWLLFGALALLNLGGLAGFVLARAAGGHNNQGAA